MVSVSPTRLALFALAISARGFAADDAFFEEKMRRLGRQTLAIEIKYQHLPAVATEEKKAANREFLVVGWDPAAALLADTTIRTSTEPKEQIA